MTTSAIAFKTQGMGLGSSATGSWQSDVTGPRDGEWQTGRSGMD